MAYNALDIARYIIKEYNRQENPVTNLKLQKMLYFAWIKYYTKTKEHLFENPIYAWKFGPVVTDVYYQYSIYVAMPITDMTEPSVEITGDAKRILDEMIEDCKDRSASSLVYRTHQDGSPWRRTFSVHPRGRIDFQLIKDLECKEFA